MILGRIFRTWREEENITLRELSPKIGISASTLSRFENGEEISCPVFVKILAFVTRTRIDETRLVDNDITYPPEDQKVS